MKLWLRLSDLTLLSTWCDGVAHTDIYSLIFTIVMFTSAITYSILCNTVSPRRSI